jgi:hypothetical protein
MGVPAVRVGIVNPDNNQLSPNENLRVFDFQRGIRTMAMSLSAPLSNRYRTVRAQSRRDSGR